jgi:uncharacterized protein (TIGR02217 family)
MGWALAKAEGHHRKAHMHRFDPRYWTVNFPRPVSASIITTSADAMRVDAVMYDHSNLIGLIWESEDHHDHPLLAYEHKTDYRGVQLRFRWKSGGFAPLNAVYGPTLTIEGRNQAGQARSWYVRLWNYAAGSGDNALVTLDFNNLAGGFMLPSEADPVWAGDIDRMFISLVAPSYDGSVGLLAAPLAGWAEMSQISITGSGAVLEVGDVMLPEHRAGMSNGYDDVYHLTPERVLRQMWALGYRGDVIHYVGMSHYMRLAPVDGALLAGGSGAVVTVPCAAWHRDMAARFHAMGLGVIWSISYELLNAYCPEGWKQRDSEGVAALTGWEPPSTLLSPAHDDAMDWLQRAAREFVAIAVDIGMPLKFQVGEPWWWIASGGRICGYDAATTEALGALSVAIADVRQPLDAAQKAMLDGLGALLAASTAALVDAARDEAGDDALTSLLLIFLPTVLDPLTPEVRRANVPVGWASPAFDILQLEDYDWVTAGRGAETAGARAYVVARLGYPVAEQDYLSGFVLNGEDKVQWALIAKAERDARKAGTARTFYWAFPQIVRDGFIAFDGEDEVQAFDAVDFPLAIGREAVVVTEFSTQIVDAPSGHEQRSSEWADARMQYDAGPGIRSEEDVRRLTDFFRARRGAARAFRFRDPFDHSSAADGGEPSALDQQIGIGDGARLRFPLIKRYGSGAAVQQRAISLPVAGSVRVSVNGTVQTQFTLDGEGAVTLASAPAAGAVVRAGYFFDVAVRFAEDRLEVSRATYRAGELASVPLIEVRSPWG